MGGGGEGTCLELGNLFVGRRRGGQRLLGRLDAARQLGDLQLQGARLVGRLLQREHALQRVKCVGGGVSACS